MTNVYAAEVVLKLPPSTRVYICIIQHVQGTRMEPQMRNQGIC